jgi:hypothetical protein
MRSIPIINADTLHILIHIASEEINFLLYGDHCEEDLREAIDIEIARRELITIAKRYSVTLGNSYVPRENSLLPHVADKLKTFNEECDKRAVEFC